MHSLYFVVTSHSSEANSRKVMTDVEQILDNTGFVYTDSLWGGGKCDWFAIGGRWSGLLSELTWAQKAVAEIRQLEQKTGIQINGIFYGRQEKSLKQRTIREEAEKIWNRQKPHKFRHTTYYRNSFENTPQADDAMTITAELWQKLQESYPHIEVYDSENQVEFTFDSVSDDELYIGKWLTVVDYHS